MILLTFFDGNALYVCYTLCCHTEILFLYKYSPVHLKMPGNVLRILLFKQERVGKFSETDSIKFKISLSWEKGQHKKSPSRHHQRQPGEQQFFIQVVTITLWYNI